MGAGRGREAKSGLPGRPAGHPALPVGQETTQETTSKQKGRDWKQRPGRELWALPGPPICPCQGLPESGYLGSTPGGLSPGPEPAPAPLICGVFPPRVQEYARAPFSSLSSAQLCSPLSREGQKGKGFSLGLWGAPLFP